MTYRPEEVLLEQVSEEHGTMINGVEAKNGVLLKKMIILIM